MGGVPVERADRDTHSDGERLSALPVASWVISRLMPPGNVMGREWEMAAPEPRPPADCSRGAPHTPTTTRAVGVIIGLAFASPSTADLPWPPAQGNVQGVGVSDAHGRI